MSPGASGSSRAWCSRSSPGSTCRRKAWGCGSKTTCWSPPRAPSGCRTGAAYHRRDRAPDAAALGLVLPARDVLEIQHRVLFVLVIEHVRERQAGDGGQLLPGGGELAYVHVHLRQLEPMEDVARLPADRLLEVALGIRPVGLVHEPGAEQRFGEEPLES